MLKKTLALALLFLSIPRVSIADGKITEAGFNTILNQFRAYAEPFLAKQGATLALNAPWDKELRPLSQGGAGGASASGGKASKVAGISLVGGLARHPLITADAVKFALCHELGHYMHGLGAEFDADTFAGSECLSALWAHHPPEILVRLPGEFVGADAACESQSAADLTRCKATMRVAYSIAQYSMFLWKQLRPNVAFTPLAFDREPNSDLGAKDVPQCRLSHLAAVAQGREYLNRCM